MSKAIADGGSVAVVMEALHAPAVVHGDVEAATAALEHARHHGRAADAGRALGLVGALTADAALLGDAYRELGELGATWRQRAVAHDLRIYVKTGHRSRIALAVAGLTPLTDDGGAPTTGSRTSPRSGAGRSS